MLKIQVLPPSGWETGYTDDPRRSVAPGRVFTGWSKLRDQGVVLTVVGAWSRTRSTLHIGYLVAEEQLLRLT